MDEARVKDAVRNMERDYSKLALGTAFIKDAIERKGKGVVYSPPSDATWVTLGELMGLLRSTFEDLELIGRWLDEGTDSASMSNAA